MFKLTYTRRAGRDIEKLNPVTQKRIKKKLELYQSNPLKFAEKLTSSELGTYRFRIGDYRVIFDIDGGNIVILRVGHRREIYRG